MKRKMIFASLLVIVLVAMSVVLASAQGVAMVSVGHGIPGADVDPNADPALPVDVIVNGVCELHDLAFGQFEGPLELVAGSTYTVQVALSDDNPDTCDGDVVIGPADFTFEAGENATIFAHLTTDGQPTATAFENNVSEILPGMGRVTVRHTADAGAVDIDINRGWYRGRSLIEIDGLENPQQAGPLDVRPGAYAVAIFPDEGSESEPVFEAQPFVTKPHKLQIAYAVGSLPDTFTLIVQTLDLEVAKPGPLEFKR